MINIFQNDTNFLSFLTTTALKLAIVPYQILPALLSPITKKY